MKIFTLSLLSASLLLASPLIEEAKKAGLKPIPANNAELMKLINNPKNPITGKKVELGKKLYFDPRLSKSNLISCNTCHNLATGGVDGVSAAIGHGWTANPHHLNSPTVYNAVFFASQFWDGRDPHLEQQAQGPIQAGPEMAATKDHVVKTVTSMPEYVAEFKGAYGKDVKVSFEKVTDTIGIFERTLVTPSRFDEFLNGDEKALSEAEKKGLKTFIDKGCATCHNGIALGGNMMPFNFKKYEFAKVGDFTGNKAGMVKVPTLRNVLETAPYFHNGQYWKIEDAIKEMARIQLELFGIKKSVNDEEAASIATFFKALTGKKPEIEYPQLPNRTLSTPKPDLK
jgi:cytochrome c peroxidase